MTQTGVVSWSQTAASNGTADSNVGMAEGMAPSAVNDGIRSLMASGAKYRDDTAGSLLTSGTSTAYLITSNQAFSSLSVLNGQELKVRFHTICGASPTLNVDGLGAKPILVDNSGALSSGWLAANSIWSLTYDNTIPAFIINGYLQGIGTLNVSSLNVTGAMALFGSAAITLSSNTNDWAPGAISVVKLTVNNAGGIALTGIVAPSVDGTMLEIEVLSASTGGLTISSQNAGSVAANRFSLPSSGIFIPVGSTVTLRYDATAARWKVVAPSNLTSGIYSANQFLASPSGGTGAVTARAITNADIPVGSKIVKAWGHVEGN